MKEKSNERAIIAASLFAAFSLTRSLTQRVNWERSQFLVAAEETLPAVVSCFIDERSRAISINFLFICARLFFGEEADVPQEVSLKFQLTAQIGRNDILFCVKALIAHRSSKLSSRTKCYWKLFYWLQNSHINYCTLFANLYAAAAPLR